MCVTWCHKGGLLYWNHDDCPVSLCDFAGQIVGQCEACRHRANQNCTLTCAPLPEVGGCCHWNVTPAKGQQEIGAAELTILWRVGEEGVAETLDRMDVVYSTDAAGQVLLDPDDLGLPEVYGIGTEPSAQPDIPISQNYNFKW